MRTPKRLYAQQRLIYQLNFCKLGCMAYSGWHTSGSRHPLNCEGRLHIPLIYLREINRDKSTLAKQIALENKRAWEEYR